MTSIFVALISAGSSILVGIFSLIGVVITNKRSNKDIEQRIAVSQAVTETKIEELTREVREHNNFANRIPVVEEQMRSVNRRISSLENAAHNILQ